MTIESKPEPAPGLSELIGEAMRHGADLAQSEMALLRAEVAANVRRVASGLALIVAAAVFCVIALGLAVHALVLWLTPVFGSEAIAAGVCAAGAAIIAVPLTVAGYNRARVDALYPELTAASIRSDARMFNRRSS